MKKNNPQAQASAWNDNVAVGAEVEYRSFPGAAPQRFKTRTPAEVLGGHTAVVWLEGKAGCVSVTACTPVEEEEQA